MKKILFDLTVCQPVGNTKYHGGGIYGFIVLSRLLKEYPQKVSIYLDRRKFIDSKIEMLLRKYSPEVIDASGEKLEKVFNDSSYSILYSPLYTPIYEDLLKKVDKKIVLTIHGLRALEMNRDKNEYLYGLTLKEDLKAIVKQTFLYGFITKRYWKQYNLLFHYHNLAFITVSEHSRSSILYHYPDLNRNQIKVFYSPSTTLEGYQKIKPFSDEKYYLVISANRWLKNAYRALLAFDSIMEKQINFDGKVVVVGISQTNRIYKKLKHKDSFVLFPYVERIQLESLFAGAYAFVYPSLNEGFGYPPLEAMKYGTPVIASPFSSISEICGDAVLYANPYSVEEIAMRILSLEDANIRCDYSQRGLQRYKVIENRQNEDLKMLVDMLIAFSNGKTSL